MAHFASPEKNIAIARQVETIARENRIAAKTLLFGRDDFFGQTASEGRLEVDLPSFPS